MKPEPPVYEIPKEKVDYAAWYHDECVRRLKERNVGKSYTFNGHDNFFRGAIGELTYNAHLDELGATYRHEFIPDGYSHPYDVVLLFGGKWRTVDVKCCADPEEDEAIFPKDKPLKCRFCVMTRCETPLQRGRSVWVSIQGWLALPEIMRLPIKPMRLYPDVLIRYEPYEKLSAIQGWIPYYDTPMPF